MAYSDEAQADRFLEAWEWCAEMGLIVDDTPLEYLRLFDLWRTAGCDRHVEEFIIINAGDGFTAYGRELRRQMLERGG